MKEIVTALLVEVFVLAATVVVLMLVVATEMVATELAELDEQAPITIAITNGFINRRKKYFLVRLVGHAQVCLATHQ